MVLVALAVERCRRDRSRCYGGSNGSLHVAAGEMKTTKVRRPTTGILDDREGPYHLYKHLSQASQATQWRNPRNVFYAADGTCILKPHLVLDKVHAIGIRTGINASEIRRWQAPSDGGPVSALVPRSFKSLSICSRR